MLNKIVNILVVLTITTSVFAQAPRAKIYAEPMSEHRLETLGLSTNSVSSGIKVTAVGTYWYFSPRNIANSLSITDFSFTLLSQPSGSTAAIEPLLPTMVGLKPDVAGNYEVKLSITTSGGTHDTTVTFLAGNYVGVGKFDGVNGSFPKCMTCHSSDPKFSTIFDKWQASGHGQTLKKLINKPGFFPAQCLKCHTTGTDHNLQASNKGFDDIAAQIGYTYTGPGFGKWDTLKAAGSGALVNLANVGCEMCHGTGSQHAAAPSKETIAISYDGGLCQRCHDEPPESNTFLEYELSGHATPYWSNSFAQGPAAQNNSLTNCVRCHDAKGFINYSYDRTTNSTGWTQANQDRISCSACHDPHGSGNMASLRFSPASGDTLANGYNYTARANGAGKLCMSCHKSHYNNETYVPTGNIPSYWGPHHSSQTDMLLGQNAAKFGNTSYPSSQVHSMLENQCVDCHMAETDSPENKNKVGGHTWRMSNPATGYDNVKNCWTCHGSINSFDDIIAGGDYDNNGVTESFRKEIDGLLRLLRIQLPPVGIDSISYTMINANNNLNERKGFWNYQLVAYDGSRGVHNPQYAVAVLQQSIIALGGNITNVYEPKPETLPQALGLDQNYPNPFNPETKISFALPTDGQVSLKVYDASGVEVATLVNKDMTAGLHSVYFNAATLPSGIYFYRLSYGTQAITKKMVLLK
ncbi:MAG: ammonia-forming cytochrome c nitrite reductase subunit c552 [Ignavibacteriales bacterium]|nr:MAG: ammonia-forming cytochrome c nitrite reductase subunit c552 [Ignavibacteriaceae bacterium]MBW7874105.1 ammonia-forming cytochrome c nitrite reductase subunit c552 [Ignavibacteria bacterium]MCZ2144203.1 ammonia-forming cytochrome c nitrite reductase subunit c552 [Ignavibacteriales bacterium]MBV6444565.1 hypothetical protein [Ignavibacteriaceae bacterium]MBZ0197955.1 ammonia-forming cytochrome c nitrite reductase subunit c552 [Ignavibacteriaceae bacterium]